MPDLFRWTAVDAIDKDTFQRGDLDYSRMGNVDDGHGKKIKQKIPSDKAFWVFDMAKKYRPEEGVVKGCVLLKITLTATDFATVTNSATAVNASGDGDRDFKGEAKHPDDILVKSNEVGAYGIGVNLLRTMHPTKIALASDDEVKNALGDGTHKASAIPKWYKDAVKLW